MEVLPRFGARAKKSLPMRHRVMAEAPRPVRPEDFEEQRQLVGGLREGVLDCIQRGEPLDATLAEATREAIQAIETT